MYVCSGVESRGVSDPRDQELEVVVSCLNWVLGTEFESSARPAIAFNHGMVSKPAQVFLNPIKLSNRLTDILSPHTG